MTTSSFMTGARVRDLFGIRLPIVGAPMGFVSGPDLCAEVSEAGGLGFLGHANVPLHLVRDEIRAVRARTDKPFGVGLLFPAKVETSPETTARPLPDFLQQFATEVTEAPRESYSHELAAQRLDIAIEEKVPVLALGLGAPEGVIERARSAGMKVIALAGNLAVARQMQALGVDAVVAQGHEAGGHTGKTSTLVLVPQILDALDLPVIAAGGIMDGRGMAAAMMLGADGVMLGTRLLATPEARTADTHKQKVIDMEADETIVSRCYTGKPSRVLRNAFIDAWRGHENEILPMPQQWERVAPIVIPAKAKGSIDVANWPTGQGAVLVHKLMPAQDVIAEVMSEFEQRLNLISNREK